MEYVVFTNVNEFLEKVEDLLSEAEAQNNLPLGILYRLNKQNSGDIYMSLVEEEGDILSIFVMTPGHNLIVVEREEGTIPFAVRSLLEEGTKVPGILGQRDAAFAFAKEWKCQTNQEFAVHMNQRIYHLEEVNSIPQSPGEMRPATLDDLHLVERWVMEFIQDTNEPAISNEDAETLATKKIQDQSVYLWIAGDKPVSMACRARSTKNVVVVNLVYTPREERKKGYASSVVSSLSKKLLKEFKYCALYTDLDNPTSNKIYQEIGYQPVCDSVMIQFK